jgi:hypothetical protein
MRAERVLLRPAAVRAALVAAPGQDALPEELWLDDEGAATVDPLPAPLVAALGLLLAPRALRVEVRAASTAVRRLTVLAALDGLAVALTRDVAGPPGPRPVEVAVLPDLEIVDEVVRRLPPLPAGTGPRPALRGVDPALLHAATVRGSDDLLRRVGGWSADGDEVVAALGGSWNGSLQLTVAGGPAAARLTWAHAAGGWWQLSPTSSADGTALLDVVPARPEDLPGVVGALLGRALVEVTA